MSKVNQKRIRAIEHRIQTVAQQIVQNKREINDLHVQLNDKDHRLPLNERLPVRGQMYSLSRENANLSSEIVELRKEKAELQKRANNLVVQSKFFLVVIK